MRSHTPARCQSRRRRQHVIPDPQPSSGRSICQGMPLRRTNRMPMRHARSESRGRPPFGRRRGVGRNGSTRSHNGSGSSAAAIPVHATSPTRIRVRRFCYTLLAARQFGFCQLRQGVFPGCPGARHWAVSTSLDPFIRTCISPPWLARPDRTERVTLGMKLSAARVSRSVSGQRSERSHRAVARCWP